jgi:hypothetical protein
MRRSDFPAAMLPLLRGLLRLALMATLAGAVFCASAQSMADDSLEYSIKSAFLFKFGEFVEWPPGTFTSPEEPLVICILGDDPFGSRLDQIVNGHAIGGRPVTVMRLRRSDQLENAHILFISRSERDRMDDIATVLRGKNILTVAEFAHADVAITLVVENNRVRFDVNLPAVDSAGLKLSSKLLSVARNVRSR